MKIEDVIPKDKNVLTIQIDDRGNHSIKNYKNGFIDESYRKMTKDEAIIAMTSLLMGFQPPRCHSCRDKQSH